MITREEFNDWKNSEVTKKLISNIDLDSQLAFNNWKGGGYAEIQKSQYVAGMAAALSDMKDIMLTGNGLGIEGVESND